MTKLVLVLLGSIACIVLGEKGSSSLLDKAKEETSKSVVDEEVPSVSSVATGYHYHHGKLGNGIELENQNFYCPYYSATNTNSASQNYASCSFVACGGMTFTASGCNACSGDQYLRLYLGSTFLTSSDDGCSTCSTITYTVSGSSSTCNTYTVREGCYSSNTCSGTVYVTNSVSGQVPSPSVTNSPNYYYNYPTYYPIYYNGYYDDNSVYVWSAGAIAGTVIGTFLCCGGIVAAIVACIFCCNQQQRSQQQTITMEVKPVPTAPVMSQSPLQQGQSPQSPQQANAYYADPSTAPAAVVTSFVLPSGQVVNNTPDPKDVEMNFMGVRCEY